MSQDLVKLLIAGAICLTVSLIAIFIWPTPYLYVTVTRRVSNEGSGSTSVDKVYRINRFSGSTVRVLDSYNGTPEESAEKSKPK